MFTWVGTQFENVLSTYVLGVVTALMSAITPIALTVLTLWILLYGWAVLRNEVSEPLNSFIWKVTKIGFVFAFALQAGFYIDNVADTANALAMGVASTFVTGAANPLALSSPYAAPLLPVSHEGEGSPVVGCAPLRRRARTHAAQHGQLRYL
jgi:type IV secretion system protein VirB6